MDDAFADADQDGEADEVYEQICAEQGIALAGIGGDVQTGKIGPNPEPAPVKEPEVDDLQARLDMLNK